MFWRMLTAFVLTAGLAVGLFVVLTGAEEPFGGGADGATRVTLSVPGMT